MYRVQTGKRTSYPILRDYQRRKKKKKYAYILHSPIAKEISSPRGALLWATDARNFRFSRCPALCNTLQYFAECLPRISIFANFWLVRKQDRKMRKIQDNLG
jgi:hypothetical protein